MKEQKTILVIGASGAQGGSVARFLLEEGVFKVRCLTRNPYSERSIALQKAGAELVTGDMDDITSLCMAMRGVYGVFGVTGFSGQQDKEYQQGKNLIFAVVINRIDFFIYSSLPAIEKISKGSFNVPQFSIKASIQEYAKTLKPDSSFIHVADHYQTFFSHLLPQKADDGNYYLQLPQGNASYATVAANDTGGVVRTMFHHPAAYKKRTVGVVGSDMPCTAYAAIMSKVLKKNILYQPISRDAFVALAFPGSKELADKYAFNEQYITDRRIDLIESHGLYPEMQSFETWLINNHSAFLDALSEQERLAC